ncbi:hypothetical protein ULVI_04795 [Cochleicola gelatinilyticus]|uniref:histidine kinase n=1 Tax=Cochleicola gelatinilyticus TaxID=1763537 RepID=A0A167IVL8_9FLAO|nr:hypothetical protein ULVI_04795 [Cochleicola gelatinilyticus]
MIFTLSYSLAAQNFQGTENGGSAYTGLNVEHFRQRIDSSNNYYLDGDYRKSIEINFDFLKDAFTSENPYYIHQGYRLLGKNYAAMKDTILAKESFEKSEKYAIESKNDTAMALTYMDFASFYATHLQNYKKAFLYNDRSIQLFEKIKDSSGLGRAYYNMIVTAMDAKEYKTAYLHLIKARKLNKFEDHSSFSIGLDYFLGEYYAQKSNYEMADKYFIKAINTAEAEGLTVELEKIYKYYSESLYNQGKIEEAYAARKKLEGYINANYEKIKSLETEALSAKFQVSEYRKDAKAAELQSELQAQVAENKSKLNTFLIIVSTCFLLIFVGLFFAYRKRKELVKELRIKNQEALKAKETSEQLSKAKTNFFSTVSHELRTPLYGVIGLSTILLEDKSLKKHESDLKSLKFSADYLLALINDVLQINKIDSKKIDDEHTSFNIRDLIRTIVSSFEYMRLQNKNNIIVHISENIPQLIEGNSVRLSQILMNLIGNACKFTESGDIYVIAELEQITESSATIRFYVKDTGIGIPKEKQDTIFEEFSQANSVNYNYQGTGLGLPIVKKLLSLSNSEIALESEPGMGSLFSFSLTYDVNQKVAVESGGPTLLDYATLVAKRILIVDDNRINQTVTKKILEKNNMICSIAENGEQAIHSVRENEYDLVLMDINMPLKNGMEATREIREFNTKIPIVALTAVEVEEMRNKIFDSGMNDIIVKPYDVKKFIQTILKNIPSPPKDKKEVKDKSHLRAV